MDHTDRMLSYSFSSEEQDYSSEEKIRNKIIELYHCIEKLSENMNDEEYIKFYNFFLDCLKENFEKYNNNERLSELFKKNEYELKRTYHIDEKIREI